MSDKESNSGFPTFGNTKTRKPGNQYNESLSALMDNESDDLELRRILKQLAVEDQLPENENNVARKKDQLLDTWRRYHLVRDAIGQQSHINHSIDMLARVRSALTESDSASNTSSIEGIEAIEAIESLENTAASHNNLDHSDEIETAGTFGNNIAATAGLNAQSNGFWGIMGQGAIAASVAIAVLFSATFIGQNQSSPEFQATLASNTSTDTTSGAINTSATPRLSGELNPNTQTMVAVGSEVDEAQRNRLQRLVSEELDDAQQIRQVPATFVPPSE